MKNLDIKKSATIEASADKAWQIIGPNFLNIADWSRGINKSWNNEVATKKFEEAPAGGRYCDVKGIGKLDEKIQYYNANQLQITWSAEGDKIPGFVSNLQNQLSVIRIDDDSCTIQMHFSANLNGIKGALMGGMVKKNFDKVLSGFVEDWTIYAETGKLSDKKQKELARMK